jgi:hypothetical protein
MTKSKGFDPDMIEADKSFITVKEHKKMLAKIPRKNRMITTFRVEKKVLMQFQKKLIDLGVGQSDAITSLIEMFVDGEIQLKKKD